MHCKYNTNTILQYITKYLIHNILNCFYSINICGLSCGILGMLNVINQA